MTNLLNLLSDCLEDCSIGLYPTSCSESADYYTCPCCFAHKDVKGYIGEMADLSEVEHKPDCKLWQIYQLIRNTEQ